MGTKGEKGRVREGERKRKKKEWPGRERVGGTVCNAYSMWYLGLARVSKDTTPVID